MTQAGTVNGLIGERVRRHRGDRGWTLDELAERSGVSRRMLISIEHGEGNPSIATLLLSGLSFIAVIFTAMPVLFLTECIR